MSKRKERTIQDVCDANSSLCEPQVKPEIKKGFSCSDRSQEIDYRSKSGTCNVCSVPCSSCYHDNQVLMKSSIESAGDTCAEHTVVNRGKRREIEQLSEMSIIETMNSSTDSSEIAVRKAFLKTSDASASDDAVVLSKFEADKVPEGYDDCLSCDTRIDDTTKMLNFNSENVHRMNHLCSSVSIGCPIVPGDELTANDQTLSQHENKKFDVNNSRINYSRRSKIRGEFSDKLLSSDLPIGLSSGRLVLSEIPASKSTDVPTNLLMVQDTSSVNSLLCGSNSRSIDGDKSSIPQVGSLEGSKEHLNLSVVGAVITDVSLDQPVTAPVSSENNDDMKAEIHSMDEAEAEDSDMVEQDVKVCDICGDAGREDLLAICCRCSDGAEHTYCMREMLAKVPEGDWLCEECKSNEKVRYGRRDKLGRVDENEKNNFGQASSESLNSSDVEGNRTRGCMNIHTKRLIDDADTEVSSGVKKPAVGSTVGTPKLSISDKATALSRENSSKNLDKRKVQSSHGSPTSDAVTVNNTPELAHPDSGQRPPNFRGTFSKSNSFTFLNSKPKVELVDQALQREKSASELVARHPRNCTIRSIGRSVSFKSTNSNYSESKIKMISPRLSNIRDINKTKWRSSFERQISLRSEDRPVNSMTSMSSASRSDKNIATSAEPCSLSVSTNHRETKPVQPGGKSMALSRSSSFASRRSADLAGSVGEFKKPSTYGLNTSRVSSTNDVNNFVEKSRHTSPNEASSCSGVFETPNFNDVECRPDGFARPGELSNSGEPSREDSGCHFRTSYGKSFRNESNLEAAIKAAMLRQPVGYKKHRYDDSSASSKGCDISSKDHLSSSSGRRIETSAAEAAKRHVGSQNLTADSHGTLYTMDNFSSMAVEALSSGGDEIPSVPLDVKSTSRDVCSDVAAPRHFTSKSFAIPGHEYIWQGSFEIYQSDKVFTVLDGIQAHTSTCASFKVKESVNKFKSRIVLNEVPRLSTWPLQFQEHGVGKDNISLFFFAKDLDSYAKSYKVWLENMMKNDLALKGSFDGVELLIFPSNQLPDNSQRWNMLFFLWGVFRAKKGSCLRDMPDTLKQFSAPQNIPSSIMSVPGNMYMLRPVTKDFLSDDISSEPKIHASESLCDAMSSKAVNGDCGQKVSSLDWLDGRQNSSCSTAVRVARATFQKPMDTCLEGGTNSIRRPFQSTLTSVIPKSEPALMELDTLVHREQLSHPSYKPSDCSLDMPPEGGICETPSSLDRMTCSQDQVKLRMVGEDLSTVVEIPMEEDRDTRGLNTEVNGLFLNHNEYLHPTSTCMETRVPYACTTQVLPENDDKHGPLVKMNRVVLENREYEACDETVIPGHSKNAERHFFPMELLPVRGMQLVGGSMPREPNSLEQSQHHDMAPNLELALGSKRKSSTLGIRPSVIRNVERKVAKECIHDKRSIKADEDDDEVSAYLSLSLSFPFPEEENTTKPAQKTEQLASLKDHVTTSLLLFRDFGDK